MFKLQLFLTLITGGYFIVTINYWSYSVLMH